MTSDSKGFLNEEIGPAMTWPDPYIVEVVKVLFKYDGIAAVKHICEDVNTEIRKNTSKKYGKDFEPYQYKPRVLAGVLDRLFVPRSPIRTDHLLHFNISRALVEKLAEHFGVGGNIA